ncbi:uncharacterized protein TrAFT101_006888 [Trichoderma asperellum]|uniref:uncharacterized protein n=1 Tax=Trichoderma asperellum TaxID=101201 RepID=UPI0033166511|nr:hypothetical protein TrAFT101_006888 [Trichoderma asperellum]
MSYSLPGDRQDHARGLSALDELSGRLATRERCGPLNKNVNIASHDARFSHLPFSQLLLNRILETHLQTHIGWPNREAPDNPIYQKVAFLEHLTVELPARLAD